MTDKDNNIWINPTGGLGDTLMVSGVLKQVIDKNPERKFNLARRTRYLSILKHHPAIDKIGYPPKDAEIITTDYWQYKEFNGGAERAYQALAKKFGLETPAEEILFFPEKNEKENSLFENFIPWKKNNIIIAPYSASPRKKYDSNKWTELVKILNSKGTLVIQEGKEHEEYIKGCYYLSGLTTPGQLISLIKKCDLVITSDNFVMHSAYLVNKPAIVLWGPTDPKVYGYNTHIHLKTNIKCEQIDECIGYKHPQNYTIACPLETDLHCVSRISIEEILSQIQPFMS